MKKLCKKMLLINSKTGAYHTVDLLYCRMFMNNKNIITVAVATCERSENKSLKAFQRRDNASVCYLINGQLNKQDDPHANGCQ